MDIATDPDKCSQTISLSPSDDRAQNGGDAASADGLRSRDGDNLHGSDRRNIVATAMPTIVGALGGVDLFSWIFGAYLLTQAILIPIYGRLADLYGRKPVLLFGIAVFLSAPHFADCMEHGFADCFSHRAGYRRRCADSGFTNRRCRYLQRRSARQDAGLHFQHFWQRGDLWPDGRWAHRDHVSWKAIFWINIPFGIIAAALLLSR